MAKRRSGECRLCGTQADTLENEDVFPTWARQRLLSELAEPPPSKQWPPRVLLKACADCNRGLGREFEEPAAVVLKPLIRGESRTLNREQMTLVAAWAWLKDIEYILGRPVLWTQREGQTTLTDKSLSYWRSQLSELRRKRRPPGSYVVRLAVIGSPNEALPYKSFVPVGWRPENATLTSHNSIGRLVVDSTLTSRENGARFAGMTRRDSRATLIWPPLQATVTVGDTTLPLNHSRLWIEEHRFHPKSGWGGGWRIRVPRGS